MFSEDQIQDFKANGMTDDEIEILQNAMALKDTVDMLPDDIEGFIREYEQRISVDSVSGVKELFELAQKNPDTFQKLVALDIIMAVASQSEPKTSENEKIETGLTDEEYKTASKNFFSTLASLSDEDRKEFMKLIANITPEQKADMIDRLKK